MSVPIETLDIYMRPVVEGTGVSGRIVLCLQGGFIITIPGEASHVYPHQNLGVLPGAPRYQLTSADLLTVLASLELALTFNRANNPNERLLEKAITLLRARYLC